MMSSRNWQRAVTVLATVVALVWAAAPADAQVTKPFKVTGGGIAPEGLRPPGEVTTHLIDGTATHLGRHTGEGNFDIYSLDFTSASTLGGTFGSHDPCTFVAANGDKLVCYYGREDKGADDVGTVQITILDITAEGILVEAFFVAQFVIQPESTGRFAGASGSWIMYAQTEPFILGSEDPAAYWWEGEGEVTVQRRNHP
jgi:hypothetical protein